MKRDELRAMLSAQKTAALAATQASKLSKDREDSLRHYLGDMSLELPTVEGRSAAVSTDLLDTVEGLMPQLMEVFAGSEEVVEFNPVGPEDVESARQETDYVNHVFMQQNPGFLVLYSFIKDALLSKVGVVKVWWETREEEERETYFDLDDAAFAIISADPEVEVVAHTVHGGPQAEMADGEAANGGDAKNDAKPTEGVPDPTRSSSFAIHSAPLLHDVTVRTRRTYECALIEGVPPEEFGIARHARSIRDT